MKDYEVVGHITEDGAVCLECGDPDVFQEPGSSVFAGSDDAEDRCIICGEWLLGEEPDRLVREREREEAEALEKEIADQEAREEAKQLEAIRDAAEEAKELEKMLAKARAKTEALAAAREKRIKDE